MELQHKETMMRVLDARLKAGAFDECAVLLFGHCNATEEMADYLLDYGVAPCAILDNNVSKQGAAYRNIPIVSPEAIQNGGFENSVVLIATRFFAEMSEQLRRLGYKGEVIKVIEYNSFAEFSLTSDTVARKTDRMLRGAKTLGIIRAQFPERHLIVCPNNALGDVYWAMAFLPAYREKNGISDTAVIVAGSGCCQVAELFGENDITQLSMEEMDELVQAIVFTREYNCIIAHHDRPYTDSIIQYLNGRFLSFIDYYRCAVYGLPKSAAPAVPTQCQAFKQADRIVRSKTVILAPYAKSVVRPPDSFWELIAREWQSKGFNVCTSVDGDEQPIRGTAALNLPLNQMKSAVEHAGVLIGLRSGLCDILFYADCRKIAVFPDCFYSTTQHKVADFFALPGWERIITDTCGIVKLV